MEHSTFQFVLAILLFLSLDFLTRLDRLNTHVLLWKLELALTGMWCFIHHQPKQPVLIGYHCRGLHIPHKNDPDYVCPDCQAYH